MSSPIFYRPLQQWSSENLGSTNVPIGNFRIRLQRLDSGHFDMKEGGFGVVYFSAISVDGISWTTCILKHGNENGYSAVKGGDAEKILAMNKDIASEVSLIKSVEKLGFTPRLLKFFELPTSSHVPNHLMFSQKLAEGRNLFDLKDTMDVDERLNVLWHIMIAIEKLHQNGIFHTDLDLNHVYWDDSSNGVQLIDWGGGFIEEQPEFGAREGKILSHKGKTYYSPVEQRESKPYTERSEVFQIGSLAYFFLVDDNNGDSTPLYRDHENYDGLDLETINDRIPTFVKELIYRATRYDAKNRFNSVSEMLQFWKDSLLPEGATLVIKQKSGEKIRIPFDNKSHTFGALNLVLNNEHTWPFCEINGSFDFLITNGPFIGNWKNTERLAVYSRPKLIKIHGSDDVFHFSISDGPSSLQESAQHLLKPPSRRIYEHTGSGEVFELVEERQHSVILKSKFTLEVQELGENDFWLNFFEV